MLLIVGVRLPDEGSSEYTELYLTLLFASSCFVVVLLSMRCNSSLMGGAGKQRGEEEAPGRTVARVAASNGVPRPLYPVQTSEDASNTCDLPSYCSSSNFGARNWMRRVAFTPSHFFMSPRHFQV